MAQVASFHSELGDCRPGAKTALVSGTSSCAMAASCFDESEMSDERKTIQELFPCSPRRQLLKSLIGSRDERKAARQIRSSEIERELLVQLGIDADGLTATPSCSSTATATPLGCDRTATADPGDKVSQRTVDHAGFAHSASAGRPPSRSGDRPSSGRRVGLSTSCGGPPRPPKPKPHRPLNTVETQPAVFSVESADSLPQERRWKSALLPFWPDRKGAVPESVDAPSHAEEIGQRRVEKPAESSAMRFAAIPLPDIPSPRQLGQSTPDEVKPVCIESCSVEESSAASHLVASAESTSTPPSGKASSDILVATRPQESVLDRWLEDEANLAGRTRQLEASATRLRDNVQRLKSENRRSRVFTPSAPSSSTTCHESAAPRSEEEAFTTAAAAVASQTSPEDMTGVEAMAHTESKHILEMRRKIAELDKVNELERQRIEEEQREAEQRRLQQEAFEQGLLKQTEREMEEHRAREAQADLERVRHDEKQKRELQERERRRKEQLQEEQKRSRNLVEQCREGRSEATQLKWALFEEELDKHWASQEAEERRRLNQYVKERQQLHKDWDKRFASERQKFASEADFTETARRHRHVRSTAAADEQFYRPQRNRGFATGTTSTPSASVPPRPPGPHVPKPPPAGNASPPLSPEESAIFKELLSLQSASRNVQKAKVKELLFKWHPDKNPACVEKATQIFQFVQRQRELVLGL